MTSIYLWVNAVLYALLAVWCVIGLEKTSDALGYKALSAGGHSEYLVVYGALQFGVSIFFAYTAMPSNNAARVGLLLALALYGPIVIVRWLTVIYFHVASPVTIGTGVLETLLLAAGAIVWWRDS